MTANFDLWDWFASTVVTPSLRADAEVVVFASDGRTELVRFLLKRCLPAKLKVPVLNAKDGIVAIEEMQLAYESLTLKRRAIPTDRASARGRRWGRRGRIVRCGGIVRGSIG